MQAKTSAAAAYAGIDNINTAMRALESSTVSVVIRGLNYILVKSYEGETNPVLIEHHPKLLSKLSELLELVNPLAGFSFGSVANDNQQQYYSILLAGSNNNSSNISEKEWKLDLPISSQVEYEYLAQNMDTNPVLQTILGILRNLSFDLANESYIAYHTTIMKHVMSVLTASVHTSSSLECLQLAFDIVANVITRIDFVGRKRSAMCSSFLEEFPTALSMPPQYLNAAGMPMKHPQQPSPQQILAYQKELYKFRISKDMSTSSSGEYMLTIRSLLPILAALLHDATMINRYYLLRALDILQKVLMNSDNDYLLQYTPTTFLERLALLLTINFTRTESLVTDTFLITGDPLGRTRPPVSMILPTQQIVQSIQQQQQWQLQHQHLANNPTNLNNTGIGSGGPGNPLMPTSSISSGPGGGYGTGYSAYSASSSSTPFPGQLYGAGNSAYPNPSLNNSSMLGSQQASFSSQANGMGGAGGAGAGTGATTASFFPLSLPAMGTLYSNTFLAEECDLEIRDLALDSLVNLCRISLSNRLNLLRVPNIIPLLFRIANLSGVATNASVSFPPFTALPSNINPLNTMSSNRNEGSAKAVELLGYLMDLPEAAPYFHTIRSELMFAACSDDLLAGVLCNHALPSFIYAPPEILPPTVINNATAASGILGTIPPIPELTTSVSMSSLSQFQ